MNWIQQSHGRRLYLIRKEPVIEKLPSNIREVKSNGDAGPMPVPGVEEVLKNEVFGMTGKKKGS